MLLRIRPFEAHAPNFRSLKKGRVKTRGSTVTRRQPVACKKTGELQDGVKSQPLGKAADRLGKWRRKLLESLKMHSEMAPAPRTHDRLVDLGRGVVAAGELDRGDRHQHFRARLEIRRFEQRLLFSGAAGAHHR
jgi:hypothetical protein